MDLYRSLSYPSRSPNWVQVMLKWFFLLSCVVTAPLSVGYLVRLVRNVARGNEFLPSFANKTQLYMDGLRCIISCFCYIFPIAIITLALTFFAVILENGEIISSSNFTILASIGLNIGVAILQRIYLFVYIFVLPLVMMCVAFRNDWASGFNFSLMKKFLRGNLLNYSLMVLVSYVISSMSSFGFLLFIVGFFISLPYASFSMAHMYGSYMRDRLMENEEICDPLRQ